MIDRSLVTLLCACTALAAIIVVEVVSEGAEPARLSPAPAPGIASPKPRLQEPAVEKLVAASLTAPLFSPTRLPADRSEPAGDAELSGVRLTGIVIAPDRRTAIFAVANAKPITRTEGEMLDKWRLDSITPLEVLMSGPNGTRALAPRPDLNLVRPTAPLPSAQRTLPSQPRREAPAQPAATIAAERRPLAPRAAPPPTDRRPPAVNPTRQQ